MRGLTRKSFLPENKISVKFCDDIGTSEGAVDLGGPKREFFTLVLDWFRNSQLFCGSDNCKYLVMLVARQKMIIFMLVR